MRAVGSNIPRIDAAGKTTGETLYPGDIDLPQQSWLRIVFAGVPHGRIRSMDLSAARNAPGVVAVITAEDVPVNEYGLIMPDQPVLCGLGSTKQAEVVRWEADHVALVVAESATLADAAARQIHIDYEELPIVTDPLAAMLPDAPVLHPNPFPFPYGERDLNSNVLLSYQLRRGNTTDGFAAADVVVESTYRTHAQEHAYLQPEAGLAYVREDGRVEVICGGQWMHEERKEIAHALNLPEEQIVVRYPAIGGAFGGREDISIQIALALAAWKTGRPVKTVWSREESIRGHHKRHPYIIKAKWGATREGKLVAAQVDLTGDAGAYAYTSTKVLGNATLAALGPYEIPNVQVDARVVYTSNCPNGAFRGFGGPQGHFAAEMQVNKLAQALRMDPVEFRLRNVLRDGSTLATGSVIPQGCTIREVVAEAARRGGWTSADNTVRRARQRDGTPDIRTPTQPPTLSPMTSLDATRTKSARGIGFACCLKNVGFSLGFPENCTAWVELHGAEDIRHAVVGCVGADVGQGAHTVFTQIAAQTLGLDPSDVQLRTEQSDMADSSGSSSASRMTFMAGNAIRGAAARALKLWENEERPARAEYVFRPRPTTGYDPETGAGDPNITYGYCAQVADVEVDLETGHVYVRRLISVNDVGTAINPQLVEGQIEGAVAQSIGWALLENLVQEDGRILTEHLSTYLIPGVLDMADVIEPVILELPDPQGPLGARGMAEMPFIPTAPAIGAAIHDAIGIWIDELPYLPERVWLALDRARRERTAEG